MYTHWGVLTCAGTPAPVLRALTDAFSAAVLREDLRARLNELGYVPVGGSPAAYAATIARDTARFTEIIRASAIRPD